MATLQSEPSLFLPSTCTLPPRLTIACSMPQSFIIWITWSTYVSQVWISGASTMTRLRLDFAVTLLTDAVGERHARRLKALSTACVFVFGCALIAMCWVWMDPVGIARHGFDAREYAAESFNFLYTERTQTLNWPTWVVQLVLPLFALCFTLHAAANLVEDLGLRPRAAIAGFDLGNAEETVN